MAKSNPVPPPVNKRSFKQKVRHNRKSFRRFLGRIEKKPPVGLDNLAARLNAEVWTEIDCLSCSNCCRTMSPTFTQKDITRISRHLGMTSAEFRDKWLYLDKKDKDWMNRLQPCQFLNLDTNMCNIYEVRPDDCAGFPHLAKRRMKDYIHVHQQNVEYCPATYRMVEKMQVLLPDYVR